MGRVERLKKERESRVRWKRNGREKLKRKEKAG